MGSRLEILGRGSIEEVPSLGRFVDESQKQIPLRLLDIAVVRNHRGRYQRLIPAE